MGITRRAILIAASALLAGLAACQPADRTADEESNAGAAAANTSAVEVPAPPRDTAGPSPEEPGVPSTSEANLPPADAEPRFAGRWAADARMCADNAWRFTDTDLATPAGSACHFSKVTKVAGGYDIAARCTAEGPETDDMLKIRFAESAKAMLFESKSIADAGLIYCGPPE